MRRTALIQYLSWHCVNCIEIFTTIIPIRSQATVGMAENADATPPPGPHAAAVVRIVDGGLSGPATPAKLLPRAVNSGCNFVVAH
jgi:hypothetical protein